MILKSLYMWVIEMMHTIKACELCCGETVVSLSRDNINSNAMKKKLREMI